jgi:hypothetical protein
MTRYPRPCPVAAMLMFVCMCATADAQTWFQTPLSPRTASYAISVSLDPQTKILKGEEVLTWKNPSNDVIQDLQFHLYLNAFRNNQSTMMRESGAARLGERMSEAESGWIDITSLRTSDGEDLVGALEFIQPDDGNDNDRTLARIPLRRPIPPRQSMTLRIGFTAKLPLVTERSGFLRDFFMVGQWFPKIAVYEPAGTRSAARGRWNAHQYHAVGEFYADFGVYDVSLTVPSSYVVGATGSRLTERLNPDTTRTVMYHAEDVHDFAWTASPAFVEVTDRWEHVLIRTLMQPSHVHQARRYISAAKATLGFFDRHVGRYPYPVMTIVDPPYDAVMSAGGMEYPTLITAGTHWTAGEWERYTENVTVHELGHNYWYGIVANNESEEAWLDEGINQYYQTRIMDEVYGPKTSVLDLAGLRIGDFEVTRASYLRSRNPMAAPIATIPWRFPTGTYGAITYSKTAAVLTTMERMLGRTTMDSVMRTYFERWAFRHPDGKDFLATCNEVVRRLHGTRFGENLDWFFDQTIYGTGLCDYQLTSLRANRFTRPGSDTSTAPLFESRVVVSRLGEVRIPVSVLVHFDNGNEVLEEWDGAARVTEFTYRRPEKVVWAKVDPEGILALDADLSNNSRTLAPSTGPVWKYTTKLIFWLQNLLQTIAAFG